MKVLTQNYKTGELALIEVPMPTIKHGHLLIRTVASAVSVGTEKSMIELAQKNLIGKALARPDWVAQVTKKIKTEGLLEAYRQADGRLNIPVPLGYSSAGVVEEIGGGVDMFSVGDSVVSLGSGYASHSEYVLMPRALCVKKPSSISFDEASFAALGGIALESLRLAKPEIGHRTAVIGLGLLGQITVQVLKANGCKVLGVDILQNRLQLAKTVGCDAVFDSSTADLEAEAMGFSRGYGLDSVIITASTKSDEPLRQAASMCMERATIVASGLVGLNIPRDLFFEKELNLVIPKGWGPGLSEAAVSEPLSSVLVSQFRWSGIENVRTFLDLVETGAVNVKALISRQFRFSEAVRAYQKVLKGDIGTNVGVVLNYDELPRVKTEMILSLSSGIKTNPSGNRNVTIAIVGAGQYARGTLLPCLGKIDEAHLHWIVSARGINAQAMAKKYGISNISSNYNEALSDDSTDLVILLTRHGLHASMVCDVLESHKHVFVEKPLAITRRQLDKVIVARSKAEDAHLFVGYNRRFSPFSEWLKKKFSVVSGPLGINFRINAGSVSRDSWIYDSDEGGGRIIGEVCHYIDLVQFFSGSLITEVYCQSFGAAHHHPTDNVAIFVRTENDCVSTISYFSGGDKSYPRERIEIIGGEAIGVLDNFRTATFSRFGRTKTAGKSMGSNWGHRELLITSLRSILDGRESPVAMVEYVNNSLTTFSLEESMRLNKPITVEKCAIEIPDNK